MKWTPLTSHTDVMPGPLTEVEKQYRREVQKLLGRRVNKAEFHEYCATLAERNISIQDALADEVETAFMLLWFSLQLHKP